MRGTTTWLLLAVALVLVPGTQATWRISTPYVDVPLFASNFNMTSWHDWDPPIAGGLSTLNVGLRGLSAGSCWFGDNNCTNPSLVGGPLNNNTIPPATPGAYQARINNQNCLVLRGGPNDLNPGVLAVRLGATPFSQNVRISYSLYTYSDTVGYLVVHYSGSRSSSLFCHIFGSDRFHIVSNGTTSTQFAALTTDLHPAPAPEWDGPVFVSAVYNGVGVTDIMPLYHYITFSCVNCTGVCPKNVKTTH